MTDPSHGEVTQLLHRWSKGRADAFDELLPIVYRELRTMASRHLRKERSGHTMQATDLVHEVYLRMVGQKNTNWQNRAHFFAIAAQAMRRILVDHARKNLAAKRIGANRKVPLDWAPELSHEPDPLILEVDEVLSRLATIDARQAQIVELRFFGGLTVKETGTVLAISEATVAREWRMAKAWLRREMEQGAGLEA